jgi:hypothetical protein
MHPETTPIVVLIMNSHHGGNQQKGDWLVGYERRSPISTDLSVTIQLHSTSSYHTKHD